MKKSVPQKDNDHTWNSYHMLFPMYIFREGLNVPNKDLHSFILLLPPPKLAHSTYSSSKLPSRYYHILCMYNLALNLFLSSSNQGEIDSIATMM